MSLNEIVARMRRLPRMIMVALWAMAGAVGTSGFAGGLGVALAGGALGLGLAPVAVAQPAAPPPPAARDEFRVTLAARRSLRFWFAMFDAMISASVRSAGQLVI